METFALNVIHIIQLLPQNREKIFQILSFKKEPAMQIL